MSGQRLNEKKEDKDGGEQAWWSNTTWGTDRLEAIGWSIFFIWIAVVVIIDISGYKENFSWWNGWAIALTAGGIAASLLGTGNGRSRTNKEVNQCP